MVISNLIVDIIKRRASSIAYYDSVNKITYAELLEEIKKLNILFGQWDIGNTSIVRINVLKDISSFVLFLSLMDSGISVFPTSEEESVLFPYDYEIKPCDSDTGYKFTCFGKPYAIIHYDGVNLPLLETATKPLYINSTSGTSGSKKYCVSNLDKILFNTKAVCNAYSIPEDTCYLSLFSAHIHMHESCMRSLLSGSTSVFTDVMDIRNTVKSIKEHEVSFIQGTPNQLLSLTKKMENSDGISVKFLECCGGSLSKQVEGILQSFFPNAKILRAWGSSETTGVCFSTIIIDSKETLSIGGCISPYRYKLVPAENDEHYHLLVGGEGVMSHIYYNQLYTAIGEWHDTGDLVDVADDESLLFNGRYNGMIKYAGENILPEEVETALINYDGIIDAIVVGMSDPIKGEFPVAMIQKKPHTNINTKMIKRYLSQNIEMQKIPKKIKITEEPLPYRESGKKDRLLVQKMFLSETEDN